MRSNCQNIFVKKIHFEIYSPYVHHYGRSVMLWPIGVGMSELFQTSLCNLFAMCEETLSAFVDKITKATDKNKIHMLGTYI